MIVLIALLYGAMWLFRSSIPLLGIGAFIIILACVMIFPYNKFFK